MTTWPARVPTVEADSPDTGNEIPKIVLEAGPSSGESVACASSIEPMLEWPVALNVVAAMINIAALISPATVIAMITSMASNRNARRAWSGDNAGIRHANHARDQELEQAEPVSLKAQDPEGDRACDQTCWQQRNAKQQLEADCRTQDLGDVGCHRGKFGDEPEAHHDAGREALATHLGQVVSRGDAELRR